MPERTELEEVAYAALSAAVESPRRDRKAAAVERLQAALAEPWELLAWAVLRGEYAQVPDSRVARGAEAIQQSRERRKVTSEVAISDPRVPDLKRQMQTLTDQLAHAQTHLNDANTALKSAREELKLMRDQGRASKEERDRNAAEAGEAREVARLIWAAMPAEGRLAYFESDDSWLPAWVKRKSPNEG